MKSKLVFILRRESVLLSLVIRKPDLVGELVASAVRGSGYVVSGMGGSDHVACSSRLRSESGCYPTPGDFYWVPFTMKGYRKEQSPVGIP